jgi:hypothetical protein
MEKHPGNMKEYLVLMREPDGRTDTHTPEEIAAHQQRWKMWMIDTQNHLRGGRPLTLNGNVLRLEGNVIVTQPALYEVNGKEIVGGYLLLSASSLDEAVALMKTCPVYEFGGFVEVREVM